MHHSVPIISLGLEMTKIKQTNAEFLLHLRDSISFLEASCAAFDAGFTGEAKRLATTIRVLIHDTDRSDSLLSLLKIKMKMVYLKTSSDFNPKNLLSHNGLVGLAMSDEGTTYKAFLGDGPPGNSTKYVYFSDWWNEIVIVDSRQAKFSRRSLILALTNKDGGAHVDPSLDEDYAHLTRSNSIGWTVSNGVDEKPLPEIELYSTRQIAYELLTSIKRYIAKNGAA